MFLSVIIPTYNEIKRLPKTLNSVCEYLAKRGFDYEVIISDGGSTDGTVDFVNNFSKEYNIKIVQTRRREGKGYGVKKGMLAASGKYALFMDADNATSIRELESLMKYSASYDVIIGSRYAGIKPAITQSFVRRAISWIGFLIIKSLTGLKFRDTQCGFKLFTKEAAKDIFSKLETKGWGFDVEILMRAQISGYKIIEVPVHWRDAQGSHLRAGTDAIKTLREVMSIAKKVRNE
jgi:dolichyl-phosphate beta-glucosyltransferase